MEQWRMEVCQKLYTKQSAYHGTPAEQKYQIDKSQKSIPSRKDLGCYDITQQQQYSQHSADAGKSATLDQCGLQWSPASMKSVVLIEGAILAKSRIRPVQLYGNTGQT